MYTELTDFSFLLLKYRWAVKDEQIFKGNLNHERDRQDKQKNNNNPRGKRDNT